MIFAAGLGTRLRPITDTIPKAMVSVGGEPLLKIILDRCKKAGVEEVVVNVHYLPDVIVQFLSSYDSGEMKIHISDESDEILETGGGMVKAKDYFMSSGPFLVCNADILTNIDIQKFYQYHLEKGGVATLAIRDRKTSRKLLFDHQFRLKGRADGSEGQEWAFSGYHIIDPVIFQRITREGKFSITDWYIDICQHSEIYGYDHTDDIWVDVGTVEKLAEANSIFEENRDKF